MDVAAMNFWKIKCVSPDGYWVTFQLCFICWKRLVQDYFVLFSFKDPMPCFFMDAYIKVLVGP